MADSGILCPFQIGKSLNNMSFSSPQPNLLTAHILAGGRASRMQEKDKGLLPLHGIPLIQHVINRLTPQVNTFCISANRHQAEYAALGWPVISDSISGFPGPLAGFLTALENCHSEWILNVPCDCPYLPDDLAKRLCASVCDSRRAIGVVRTEEGMQPTFCLLHRSLVGDLSRFLQQGGRKAGHWIRQQHAAIADFSGEGEAFININTPDDLQHAEEKQPRTN